MSSHRTNPATRAGHGVIRIPRAVAGMRGLTDTERTLNDPDLLVYLALVDLADNTSHLLRVETARIATRAGVHVATVRRVLKSCVLLDLGLVRLTDEASLIEVVAPSAQHDGGFLSVPRAALWTSPAASIEMPAYAVQSLLVLIAHADWGNEHSTSLRASRFRQTMANDMIDLRRFERGLQWLDLRAWVRIESQQYSAAMAQWGMARRMPTVRVIDWAALPAYQKAALEVTEGIQEALDVVPLATAPRNPAVPAQRRTEPVPVPSVSTQGVSQIARVEPPRRGSDWDALSIERRIAEPQTSSPVGQAIAAAYQGRQPGVEGLVTQRLSVLVAERGWTEKGILSYLVAQAATVTDVSTLSDGDVAYKWLLNVGLPSVDFTVNALPSDGVEWVAPSTWVPEGADAAEWTTNYVVDNSMWRTQIPSDARTQILRRVRSLLIRGWSADAIVERYISASSTSNSALAQTPVAFMLSVLLPSPDAPAPADATCPLLTSRMREKAENAEWLAAGYASAPSTDEAPF